MNPGEWLLAILACPQCKGELVPQEDVGELACLQCLLSYPIREGVPELVQESARRLRLPADAQEAGLAAKARTSS